MKSGGHQKGRRARKGVPGLIGASTYRYGGADSPSVGSKSDCVDGRGGEGGVEMLEPVDGGSGIRNVPLFRETRRWYGLVSHLRGLVQSLWPIVRNGWYVVHVVPDSESLADTRPLLSHDSCDTNVRSEAWVGARTARELKQFGRKVHARHCSEAGTEASY